MGTGSWCSPPGLAPLSPPDVLATAPTTGHVNGGTGTDGVPTEPVPDCEANGDGSGLFLFRFPMSLPRRPPAPAMEGQAPTEYRRSQSPIASPMERETVLFVPRSPSMSLPLRRPPATAMEGQAPTEYRRSQSPIASLMERETVLLVPRSPSMSLPLRRPPATAMGDRHRRSTDGASPRLRAQWRGKRSCLFPVCPQCPCHCADHRPRRWGTGTDGVPTEPVPDCEPNGMETTLLRGFAGTRGQPIARPMERETDLPRTFVEVAGRGLGAVGSARVRRVAGPGWLGRGRDGHGRRGGRG